MDCIFEKDNFIETVRNILRFGEGERELTASIRGLSVEIGDLKNRIRQTKEELLKTVFMRRSRKGKKQREIERYQKEIEDKTEKKQQLEEERRKLNLRCFGMEQKPPVFLGCYPQDEDGALRPLEWDVLYGEENFVLLVTRHVIDQMRYAMELEKTPWKDSCIRHFLNGTFLERYFSREERSLITRREQINTGNDAYHTPGSENTSDFVFLPSIEEVKNFSAYDMDRVATATEYAKKKGVFVSRKDGGDGGSYWWLRSNGGNMINAAIVNFNGYVFEYGFYVNSDRYGIRPCVWIKL